MSGENVDSTTTGNTEKEPAPSLEPEVEPIPDNDFRSIYKKMELELGRGT